MAVSSRLKTIDGKYYVTEDYVDGKLEGIATEQYVEHKLSGVATEDYVKQELKNVADPSEIADIVLEKSGQDMINTVKADVMTSIEDTLSEITEDKADKETVYTKEEVYTKEQVTEKVTEQVTEIINQFYKFNTL